MGVLEATLRNLGFIWWTQDTLFSQTAIITEYSDKCFTPSMSFKDYINPTEYALLFPFYRYRN